MRLSGLDGVIEIRRDRWGAPHITAQTRHDLWFAQGFCQGQDRLWQLELYRRVADGRLAEIAGPAAVRLRIGSCARSAWVAPDYGRPLRSIRGSVPTSRRWRRV